MNRLSPWIFCPQPKPNASLRLFCIPYAGAGASVFRGWSFEKLTGDDIEVCALRLPGREIRLREPVFNSLQPLIASITSNVLPYLDRPYVCFGHSVGALICFEWMRSLRDQGVPLPLRLFVSARQAPQIPMHPPWSYSLCDHDLKMELRRYSGTPEAVLQNDELMSAILPTLRADLEINETYIYTAEEPLDCPISAFGGLLDEKVNPQSIEAWRSQTSQAFKARFFREGHFFIKQETDSILEAIVHDIAWSG
ncbi:MAG: thioesterase II family protein [Elainellaceae cyanobacterium]